MVGFREKKGFLCMCMINLCNCVQTTEPKQFVSGGEISHIFVNIIVVFIFLMGLDLRSYIISTNLKLYCITVGKRSLARTLGCLSRSI